MKYLRCLFPLLAFALMFQAGPLLSAEKPASLPELARNGSTEYSILLPEKTGRVMDTALASVKPGAPAYTRLKTEQLSITYMILEQWNMGKMERTPEEILALLKDFETECAHSRILGLTEHDWDGHTRKEWIQSLRGKAAALIQARPSGGGALKTAAAF